MRRRWWLAGAVLAGALLWWAVPFIAMRMEFFRVRRVEFVGMRHLAPETALAARELPARLNIFADLDSIELRARAIPGVARAEVGRRMPGTLVVQLVELPPVAMIHRRGRLVFMD